MLELDKGLENLYFITMGLKMCGGFKLWVERGNDKDNTRL